MKVIVIDNYDSFTYNLVHYLEDLGCNVAVKRNDQLKIEDIEPFDKIVLSPGPGIPDEAGLLKPIIEAYAKTKPILGVCLGHQAIGEVFGGTLVNLDKVYHGVATPVEVVQDDPLFEGLGNSFEVGRYHSWVVQAPLPEELVLLAQESNGQVMAMRHKTYDLYGVQFHPESILSPSGKKLLNNWLKL